jgi:cell wall-associated NlpC family hydrolase
MITGSPYRVRAIALLPFVAISGCTQATLGVSPQTILSTVIANLPRSSVPSGGSSTSRRPRIPASTAPTAEAANVLRTADSYVGVKYVWGGNTPHEGFDCSGFTRYVFDKYGIALPRTAREQARSGVPVSLDFRALHPGDIMLFAEPGQAISHVAIYAGNGRIIHSSTAVGGVGYTDLNAGGEWFVQNFVAARRLL